MNYYELLKDIPLAKAGTIFYYDPDDARLGSIGAGCLKLAWDEKGNCQDTTCGLCADTIVFHADGINDEKWFKEVKVKNKIYNYDKWIRYPLVDSLKIIKKEIEKIEKLEKKKTETLLTRDIKCQCQVRSECLYIRAQKKLFG